jgi:hypothetical protein
MNKSLGRELAMVLLAFWGVLTWHYFFNVNETPELVLAYSGAFTGITVSVFGFAGAMFAVDKVVKNK